EQRLAPFEVFDPGEAQGGDLGEEGVGQHAQGQGAGLPAAGREPAEEAASRGVLVEVEGQGIELAGEGLDGLGGHGDGTEGDGLAGPQVLEMPAGGGYRIGHDAILYVN